MPRYKVNLTEEEIKKLKEIVNKGGKGYRIKHAQILLKLDAKPENAEWTYELIQSAYGTTSKTIAEIAKRFVNEGLDAALERKKQENHYRKVTGEVEAAICQIACSQAPDGRSHWTMQMIADKLVELKIIDSISDTTVCEVMKKTRSSLGEQKNGVFPRQVRNL